MAKLFNQQKHTDQKNRLLTHARHLFAVQGVKETSMSQIASACKVTKATLYHYFKNKETILKEILHDIGQNLEAGQQSVQPRNLAECLNQIARTHLKQMEQPATLEVMKITISEIMKNPDVQKFHMNVLMDIISRGAQTVAPFVPGKKSEKELRLIFFQFMASLYHYDWYVKMIGDPTGFIGGEEAFIQQLVKTYTQTFQS
jgi:AcrR family transcriptional regulator